MSNAIDLSFSVLDVSSVDSVGRPVLDGIELVIQDLWTGGLVPTTAPGNLRAARDAGKLVAGYAAINPRVPSNVDAVAWALPMAPAFVALDCELYPDLTPAKVRAESDRLAALLPGAPRVIYTVESYWRDVMGDDASFGDHWLWDARPGGRPFVPYGAWRDESRVIGVQTTSSVQLGMMSVDYDQFHTEVLRRMAADPQIQIQRALMMLAGDALNNDLASLVARLAYFGVIPPQPALKASL